MKTAIVTGASSGIGYEISKTLLSLGYKVYGFGRDFTCDKEPSTDNNSLYEAPNFNPIVCDVTNIPKLTDIIQTIRAKNEIHLLVNNAGVGYFGPHEELNAKKLHAMVSTNLEVPLVLTQLLLRDLKKNQGTILNISSVTATKSNTYGCAYGATKAGLTSFSKSLFDETRKYGVRVIAIQPDMTKTQFYRNANFKEGDTIETYLLPSEVASTVEYALTLRDGLVLTELTLQPQYHRITKKR